MTFEEIRDVSPLLASRSGLTIDEASTMQDAARKVAASAVLQGDETVGATPRRDW